LQNNNYTVGFFSEKGIATAVAMATMIFNVADILGF
jgi:hypothetical protein